MSKREGGGARSPTRARVSPRAHAPGIARPPAAREGERDQRGEMGQQGGGQGKTRKG